jgi:cytochrome c oxidase subunit 2
VELANGERVVADAEYVRESIVAPSARITAGYQPVMPTYQGLVSEEGLLQLIAYIQTLGGEEAEAVPAAAGGGAAPATGAATAPASSETEGSTP